MQHTGTKQTNLLEFQASVSTLKGFRMQDSNKKFMYYGIHILSWKGLKSIHVHTVTDNSCYREFTLAERDYSLT